MRAETSNPVDENPSATLLRNLLRPKLAQCPDQVYRLTPYESELLAQCGRERHAIMQRMIAEGFLDKK